ncbi:MAG: hypothetical protein U1F54_09175 [Burkholderiales bacterium]
MTTIRIQAESVPTTDLRDEIADQLPDIARELAQAIDTEIVSDVYESGATVRISVNNLGGTQVSRFIDRIIELSRTTGHEFAIEIQLDSYARLRQLAKRPGDMLGDGHLVWVRPTEREVLHAYFAYLFGPTAP